MLNFDHIVFGPIKSRRLHSSLGINLLPAGGKVCNFDCIYCECGWNADSARGGTFPSLKMVQEAMETRFRQLSEEGAAVDSITFSGNGEPTLHPDFPAVIDLTVELRNKYLPSSAISVLSNAACLNRQGVVQALRKVDNPILKLDAPTDALCRAINGADSNYSVRKAVEAMSGFAGNFILQTMFMHGAVLDYSSDRDSLDEWMNIVRRIKPRLIMAYTLDRPTPSKGITAMPAEEIETLLRPLFDEGFKIQIN